MVFSFLTYNLASLKPLDLEHESELPHRRFFFFSKHIHDYHFVVGSQDTQHVHCSVPIQSTDGRIVD